MQHSTGEPFLDLFAAIIRQAIADAHRGKLDAIFYLQEVWPSYHRQQGWPKIAWRFTFSDTTGPVFVPFLRSNLDYEKGQGS